MLPYLRADFFRRTVDRFVRDGKPLHLVVSLSAVLETVRNRLQTAELLVQLHLFAQPAHHVEFFHHPADARDGREVRLFLIGAQLFELRISLEKFRSLARVLGRPGRRWGLFELQRHYLRRRRHARGGLGLRHVLYRRLPRRWRRRGLRYRRLRNIVDFREVNPPAGLRFVFDGLLGRCRRIVRHGRASAQKET